MFTKRNRLYMRPNAFTLIELLVVISIIALLMSIMMPALSKVREMGKATVCRANLRQFMLATEYYAEANKGRIPVSFDANIPATWHGLLASYVGGREVSSGWTLTVESMHCPSDKGPASDNMYYNNPRGDLSYSMNFYVNNLKKSDIKRPSECMLYADYDWRVLNTNGMLYHIDWLPYFTEWHGQKTNVAFVDGRVEAIVTETILEDGDNIYYWSPSASKPTLNEWDIR